MKVEGKTVGKLGSRRSMRRIREGNGMNMIQIHMYSWKLPKNKYYF